MTPEKEPQQKRRREGPSEGWYFVGLLTLLGLLAALIIVPLWLSQQLRAANDARDALANQVQSLGQKPVAGPPGSRGDVGPGGAPGKPGKPGEPGEAGREGKPGEAGREGKEGQPGKAGQAGERGEAGQPGKAGEAGAPGAPGAPGGDGQPGAPGAPGSQGPPGERGERGPAGPSCPEGYSLQAPAWDPDALVCRRDSSPPANDPPILTANP